MRELTYNETGRARTIIFGSLRPVQQPLKFQHSASRLHPTPSATGANQINVIGVQVLQGIFEVLLDEDAAMLVASADQGLSLGITYTGDTHWSFVVIHIWSRGMPDFLIATPVACSVPVRR